MNNYVMLLLVSQKRRSYSMHRPHRPVRPHWTVGRPCDRCRWDTGHTGISDGVSRCGELFDLTDYGACGVGGTTKSTTIFLSSV